ncbi:Crp/Fnr family transcriptional regulator [Hydrogenophaga sp.]|uniref:Crp/Fnr family transcriptional regulator n=1 Tax=Hydrogenophaga sp. TaxID=1904254 RepID=UPI003F6FE6BF
MPADHPTNRLLAALSRARVPHWHSRLEKVELGVQHPLQTPGEPIEFVHFPQDALVGLLHVGPGGAAEAPVALVGNDGVVGVAPFLGEVLEGVRAVVLHPGSAWRLPTAALRAQPSEGAVMLHVVLRYLQALNVQISQAALCRLHHTVPQRLCRWLQDAFDRVPGETLDIDVTALGAWLDADGEAVQQAANLLVRDGVIRMQPGRTVLLDRPALALRACNCHALVKLQAQQLFPQADRAL